MAKPKFKLPKIKLPKGARATRVEKRTSCDRCGYPNSLVWRYKNTSKGTVYLCTPCKDFVREKSFGKVDASTATIYVGILEGNRSRH